MSGTVFAPRNGNAMNVEGPCGMSDCISMWGASLQGYDSYYHFLDFLKAQWVAPLGSIALIFNFIFAKILVGTKITRKDVLGTIVVMFSVVWIVIFGGMNSGGDIEESLTISELKALFSRLVFIIYFSVLNMVVFTLLSLGLYAYWAISLDDESGQIRKKMKTKLTKLLGTNWFSRIFSGLTLEGDEDLKAEARDLRLRKVVAMIMATSGGLLASQTLLLAKSGIKLVTSTFAGHNQFYDMLSSFILFILVFTAILQASIHIVVCAVYCMNTALKLYDSVLVVPMFYGYYTAFGLINSTIYLNQIHSYQPWVLILILLGIGLLIFGVRMLSVPKPEVVIPGNNMPSDARNGNHRDDGEEGGSKAQDGIQLNKGGRKTDKIGSLEKAVDDSDIAAIRKSSILEEVDKRGRAGLTALNLDGSRGPGVGIAGSIVSANVTRVLLDEDQGPGKYVHTRRSSLPHTVLKAFGLQDRRSSVDRGREGRGSRLPQIDTSFAARGRSETRRNPTSARLSSDESRPMSPSEFRAQYTNSPFPIKPKHLQEGAAGLGGHGSSSLAPKDQCGRSPRWTIGSAKMDQVFEDLNPFKVLRRNSIATSTIMPASPSQVRDARYRRGHSRRDSSTGLPSEWEEPNRRMKHSMLFGEHGSVGSRNSSRSSSPAPSGHIYSPAHSRRQSIQEGGSGIWATNAAMAHKMGGPLSPVGAFHSYDGEESPREPQSYQNHFFTGTPPPASSLYLPPSHHQHRHRSPSFSSSATHGKQLSFTTKNDQGLAATLAAVGGGQNVSSLTGPTSFASSTGTFGATSSGAGSSMFPLSVQQQLQQLQQHQHHPTSQLQHSMTTSSISSIGSAMPIMSTSTSLAQIADGEHGYSSGGGKHGSFPESVSSTSLWMGMTPSQSMQAIELDQEEL
ncbi:hypothetical protein BGZ58_007267 [Dissophora ornata]|nr:hypothetical protein BGZ58_007267 [Dissophora ornata]